MDFSAAVLRELDSHISQSQSLSSSSPSSRSHHHHHGHHHHHHRQRPPAAPPTFSNIDDAFDKLTAMDLASPSLHKKRSAAPLASADPAVQSYAKEFIKSSSAAARVPSRREVVQLTGAAPASSSDGATENRPPPPAAQQSSECQPSNLQPSHLQQQQQQPPATPYNSRGSSRRSKSPSAYSPFENFSTPVNEGFAERSGSTPFLKDPQQQYGTPYLLPDSSLSAPSPSTSPSTSSSSSSSSSSSASSTSSRHSQLQRVRSLQAAVQASTAARDELLAKAALYDELVQRNAELVQRNDELVQRNDELMDGAESYRAEIERERERGREEERRRSREKESHKKLMKEQEQRRAALEEKLAASQFDLAAMSKSVSQSETELNLAAQRESRLKEALATLHDDLLQQRECTAREREQAERAEGEAEREREERGRVEGERDEGRELGERLGKELQEMAAEREVSRAKLLEGQAAIEENAKLKADVKKMKGFEGRASALEETLGKERARAEEAEKRAAEIEKAREESESKVKSLSEFPKKFKSAEVEIKALRQVVEELTAKLGSAETERNEVKAKVEEVGSGIDEAAAFLEEQLEAIGLFEVEPPSLSSSTTLGGDSDDDDDNEEGNDGSARSSTTDVEHRMSPLKPRSASSYASPPKQARRKTAPYSSFSPSGGVTPFPEGICARDAALKFPARKALRPLWKDAVRPMLLKIVELRENNVTLATLNEKYSAHSKVLQKRVNALIAGGEKVEERLAKVEKERVRLEEESKKCKLERDCLLKQGKKDVLVIGRGFKILKRIEEAASSTAGNSRDNLHDASVQLGVLLKKLDGAGAVADDDDDEGSGGQSAGGGSAGVGGGESVSLLKGIIREVGGILEHAVKRSEAYGKLTERLSAEAEKVEALKKKEEESTEEFKKERALRAQLVEEKTRLERELEERRRDIDQFPSVLRGFIDQARQVMEENRIEQIESGVNTPSARRRMGSTMSDSSMQPSSSASASLAWKVGAREVDDEVERLGTLFRATRRGYLEIAEENKSLKAERGDLEQRVVQLNRSRQDLTQMNEAAKSHIAELVERHRAEKIVEVADAEEKVILAKNRQIESMSQENAGLENHNKQLREEIASLRKSVGEYREQHREQDENRSGHENEKERVVNALRLSIRCILPLMQRVSELRIEKKILWSMVLEGWRVEKDLGVLADAVASKFSARRGGDSAQRKNGQRRPVSLRSAVIAVLAANRLAAFGSERRSNAHFFEDDEEDEGGDRLSASRRLGEEHSIKRRRARTRSNMVGLVPDHHIEGDFEALGAKLPALKRNGGGEKELDAVISALVLRESASGTVLAMMTSNSWAGGSLIHDLGRGLFNWIRRGGSAASSAASERGDLVGSVRRCMASMARKLNEMEEVERSMSMLRESEKSEFVRLKEYSEKLLELLNREKANSRELEQRATALAAECLESVPASRLAAVNDELRHAKQTLTDVTRRHAQLQSLHADAAKAVEENERVLAIVREELHRTNATLDDERHYKEALVDENARLRTYSEAKEQEAAMLQAAASGPATHHREGSVERVKEGGKKGKGKSSSVDFTVPGKI